MSRKIEFRVLKKKKKSSPCMSCDLNVDYNSLPLQQRIGRWEQNYLFYKVYLSMSC
jgi:hypothetical protein